MFVEKIKNQIWIIKLKLEYLLNKKEDNKKVKPKTTEKEICRLFLHGKCRFGAKCKFLHQKPQVDKESKNKSSEDDPYFLLEIRFPEGNFPLNFHFLNRKNNTFPFQVLNIRTKRHIFISPKMNLPFVN